MKEKNHTNSIAPIWASAPRPAVSFACLKLRHAAKETKYKIGSISEYYVTIKHATPQASKIFVAVFWGGFTIARLRYNYGKTGSTLNRPRNEPKRLFLIVRIWR